MLTKAAKSSLRARVAPLEDTVLEDYGNGRVRTAMGVVIQARDEEVPTVAPAAPAPVEIPVETPVKGAKRKRKNAPAAELSTPAPRGEPVEVDIAGIKLAVTYLYISVSETVVVLTASEPPPFVPPVFSYEKNPEGEPLIQVTVRGEAYRCAYTGMNFTDSSGNLNLILVRL